MSNDRLPEVEATTAKERWVLLRLKAGISSDRELERRAGFTAGTFWQWTVRRQDPLMSNLLKVKELLGISFDELVALIQGLRAEAAEEKRAEGQVAPDQARAENVG